MQTKTHTPMTPSQEADSIKKRIAKRKRDGKKLAKLYAKAQGA